MSREEKIEKLEQLNVVLFDVSNILFALKEQEPNPQEKTMLESYLEIIEDLLGLARERHTGEVMAFARETWGGKA